MRNRLILFPLVLFIFNLVPSFPQTISNYEYKFDNGMKMVTEKGWNLVNISQTFNILDTARTKSPLLIKVNSIGDLISESKFKVFKDSSEVNPEIAAVGSYKLSVECRLLQNNGSISFEVNDVVIKEKLQTILTISVHNTEILIQESNAYNNGLMVYETYVIKNTGQNGIETTPHFYAPGTVSPEIPPAEALDHYLGKNKPGIYDIKTNIELKMTGFSHIIWLQGITLKPDIRYVFSFNLNVGELRYSGGDSNVKAVHLYPAGTANKLKGVAKPQKNIEVFGFERPSWFTISPPGTYDILLEYGPQIKYEWRKNVVCKVGEQTDIN